MTVMTASTAKKGGSSRPAALEELVALKDEFDTFRDDCLDENKKEGYQEKVLTWAETFQQFCDSETDLVLAYLQLNREDPYELIQPLYCGVICETLAMRKGIPPRERLPLIAAALTHDAGMYTLREALHNQTQALSSEQLADLKLHTLRSVKLLRNAGVSDSVWLESVQQHHERLDGSGYPHGLQMGEISFGARMIAIADIYTAMTKPHGAVCQSRG
jgi:HD-GYP domain-containing protein (c-di-GMP phosphodiesterase class II)